MKKPEITHLSYSRLKQWLVSPQQLAHYLTNKEVDWNESFVLGSLYENYKNGLDKEVVLFEDFRTKEARLQRDAYLAENNRKKIVATFKLNEKAIQMAEIAKKDQEDLFLFKKDIYFESDMYGFKFKGVIDLMSEDTIIDDKTTSDIYSICKSVGNYKYLLQAAIYLSAHTHINKFIFRFIESNPPYLMRDFVVTRTELADLGIFGEVERICHEIKAWTLDSAPLSNKLSPLGIGHLSRWQIEL